MKQVDRSITDPTYPVGAWDGRSLVGAPPEVERAFRQLDLPNLPAELWCAASLQVAQRIANGTPWGRLHWSERRALTVAILRAVAYTLVNGEYQYRISDTKEEFLAGGRSGSVIADPEHLTAALITASEPIAQTVEVHDRESGRVERRQPPGPNLLALLACSPAQWEDAHGLGILRSRSPATAIAQFDVAVSTQDPLVVAVCNVRVSKAWVTDLWMSGTAVVDGRIVTEIQGATALAAEWSGSGRWIHLEPHRVQRQQRDEAWRPWPAGAEMVLEESNAVFNALLVGDRGAAAAAIFRTARWSVGTVFRSPTVQYLHESKWAWWDAPAKAHPPSPERHWDVVRAIYGWRRAFVYWPVRALPVVAQLLDEGMSTMAARTYATLAQASQPLVCSERDLRVEAMVGPFEMANVIAELTSFGLLYGEDNAGAGASVVGLPALRQACRDAGLRVTGNRADLVMRLAAVPGVLEDIGTKQWRILREDNQLAERRGDQLFIVRAVAPASAASLDPNVSTGRSRTARPSGEPRPSSETEELMCRVCGSKWVRALGRGRKPHRCPSCQERE